MSSDACPVCVDPATCKGYPRLWHNLARPDGHRWREIHDRINDRPPPPPPTPEEIALRAYLERHGCGGCP